MTDEQRIKVSGVRCGFCDSVKNADAGRGSMTKVIDVELTLGRLRELQAMKPGVVAPEWLNTNIWFVPLSQLARDAADLLERYKSDNKRWECDMTAVSKVLVELRKGLTGEGLDSSVIDALIILLDSHLF